MTERATHRVETAHHTPAWDRVMRITTAAVVLIAVVAAVIRNETYRSIEAALAADVMRPFLPGVSGSSGTVLFLKADGNFLGLEVTAECTSLILIGPLLATAAALLATTKVRWWRISLGSVVMIAIVTAVNEFRLALIAYATQTWGIDPGYEVSHTFVGSVIGIFGFVAGLAALLLIGLGRQRLFRRK